MTNEQQPTTAELREMAEEARQWIVDLVAGRRQWRMCIPPQSDDTDIVLIRLYKEFLAALDRVDELEARIKANDPFQNGWYGSPDPQEE